MSPARGQLAPAKVNLYLHVGPVQPDGYHPVESLMVFADIGDRLTLDPGADGFEVRGPFGHGLENESGNLVTLARALFEETYGPGPPARLVLDKALPIAAGLGGGSSDAAAALRMLAQHRGYDLSEQLPRLEEIASRLGADGPACLYATSAVGRGRGDQLTSAPTLPRLPAVLVNPGLPSPTGAVYRNYDRAPSRESLAASAPNHPLQTPLDVASWLSGTRNDLAAPAIELEPAIADVLAYLERWPGTLLARMSGSGATCFALCATEDAAGALAGAAARDRPSWWVRACQL